MLCGQMLVAIALVVLAKLTGGVALALQHRRHGAIGLLPALLGAWQADLGHAATHGHAAADESGATGSARLLAVVVGKGDAFLPEPVDIRRLVAHHASAVKADVPESNVVAPNDEDVGLLTLCLCMSCDEQQGCSRQRGGFEVPHPANELSCFFHC